MSITLSSQISAVRRMSSYDVIKKLSRRPAEQDLLIQQLHAAAATLEAVYTKEVVDRAKIQNLSN